MNAISATMRIGSVTRAIDRDHYLVAAYDSIEHFNQHIVVVLPDLAELTWVLRSGARTVRRSNVMALAVPSLETLTLPIARQLTRVATDYITVREFPLEYRRRGIVRPGALVRHFSARA